ncbi:hypothetical protein OROMI_010494 [Orobanche minor]
MMMAAALDTTEEKDLDGEAFLGEDGTMLFNTSREMEGKYLDYLSTMIAKEIVPVGGLIRDPTTNDGGGSDIMEWLGSKDELSTVFVSFGSEYFLSRDEIEEVACGLELSGVNFIWVLRFTKGEEVGGAGEALPERFSERIGERGRIVEKWAPQAEILRHRSVGGFVSHCGWNSLRESIDCGVPIVAVPMHLDQPVNAKLVAELGVGAEVRRDGKGRIKREEISRVIRDVVVGGKGEELRKRVGEQRERIRLTSRDEVEEVARKLTEICVKGKATVTLV